MYKRLMVLPTLTAARRRRRHATKVGARFVQTTFDDKVRPGTYWLRYVENQLANEDRRAVSHRPGASSPSIRAPRHARPSFGLDVPVPERDIEVTRRLGNIPFMAARDSRAGVHHHLPHPPRATGDMGSPTDLAVKVIDLEEIRADRGGGVRSHVLLRHPHRPTAYHLILFSDCATRARPIT